MTPDTEPVLRAVIGRIIPSDQDPGALDLGTDRFVLKHLAADHVLAAAIRQGLESLDAEALAKFRKRFVALAAEEQDELLRSIEHLSWFIDLAELTAEGFYADPGNGGNENALSWRMIGYQHRLPDGPNGPMRPAPEPTDEQ
jgi:Gluconate 2-dehydrogenase subunit 3